MGAALSYLLSLRGRKKSVINFVLIWRWDDAPEEWKKLSSHDRNQDYLAYIPRDLTGNFQWLEGTPFGTSSIEKHTLSDGSEIWIGLRA